jgi:hypothetical protein
MLRRNKELSVSVIFIRLLVYTPTSGTEDCCVNGFVRDITRVAAVQSAISSESIFGDIYENDLDASRSFGVVEEPDALNY